MVFFQCAANDMKVVVQDSKLMLHVSRKTPCGNILDSVVIHLPLSFITKFREIENRDGIDYESLKDLE